LCAELAELPQRDIAPAALRLDRAWWVAPGMAGAVALALFFRLYRLDTFLHWAFGDEMAYGLEGQHVMRGDYKGLFAFTWDQAPATYAYLLAIVQHLFGATLHTGRMVSVVIGTLAVPLVALCARELDLSWTSALLAAGLLAVSHWHTHFSRMTLPAVTTGVLLLLALYSVMIAFRRGQWWLFCLSGVLCGFAPYMFLSNRIIVVILVLWFVYLLLFHFPWVRRSWPKIVLFAGSFTLVVLPLALFWLHNPEWFLGPERHVGIMYNVSYWAAQHPGQAPTAPNILLHQLPLALGMFTIYGGPFPPWGGSYAPAMDALTGWLLFAALGYALWRWRRPLVALVLIWFAAIWFFGVVLTLDAPQMEHAVGLIPAAFLLIAFLCEAIGRVIIRQLARPALYTGFVALLVLVSGVLNYQAFFQTWGSQLAGSDGFGWQWYDAATYVARHKTPHGTAIYAQGYPDEFFRFLAPHAQEFPAAVTAFRPASLYLVMAGAPASPAAVAAHVPGAHMEAVRDVDGDVAFTAVVPPTP
jgi:4-amino-4-deoxy-L-arabinose transferase-like glycosyltransferase